MTFHPDLAMNLQDRLQAMVQIGASFISLALQAKSRQ